MVWNGTEFLKEAPESSPAIQVSMAIIHHAHQSFGKKWTDRYGELNNVKLRAFTDTYTQTCTSGPDILAELQYLPPL